MSEDIKQNSGYRVESGTSCSAQGKVDYAVSTDNNQGIIFFENGNLLVKNNATSMELCGLNITDDKTPAKTIDAAKGDIHIRAEKGTIIIRAANIRFEAVSGVGGEITLQASKVIHLDAPTITTQGTNVTIAAANNVSVSGNTATLFANLQAEVQSGIDADKSSVFGKLIDAITRFKKFFESICSN